MKAVQLNGFAGLESLKLVEIDRPTPSKNEVLIQVKAAGINFAELEMVRGRYQAPRPLPFTMGFEAAGIVADLGSGVTSLKVGDRITSIVSSGGYAEYATADASRAISHPSRSYVCRGKRHYDTGTICAHTAEVCGQTATR